MLLTKLTEAERTGGKLVIFAPNFINDTPEGKEGNAALDAAAIVMGTRAIFWRYSCAGEGIRIDLVTVDRELIEFLKNSRVAFAGAGIDEYNFEMQERRAG